MATRCLSCGDTIEGIAQFCDVCQEQRRQQRGFQAPQPAAATVESVSATSPNTSCPSCGAALPTGARFCQNCGNQFHSDTGQQHSTWITDPLAVYRPNAHPVLVRLQGLAIGFLLSLIGVVAVALLSDSRKRGDRLIGALSGMVVWLGLMWFIGAFDPWLAQYGLNAHSASNSSQTTATSHDTYPSSVVQNFMDACMSTSGGRTGYCSCAIGEIQKRYTLTEFAALETRMSNTGQVPEELAGIVAGCQ